MWLAAPAAVALALIFVIPLVIVVVDSLTTAEGFSFDRYQQLFSGGFFWPILLRTVIIALLVTLVTAVLGYPLAYAATRLPKVLAGIILICIALPFFTSTLVRSYAWVALLSNNGVVNKALVALGIFSEPQQLVFNDVGVVIGMSQVLLPMMTLPIFSAMQGIDRLSVRAARALGASPFSAWRSIYLPQSMRGLMAGISLVFLVALGFYTTPALLGSGESPMIALRIDTEVNVQNQFGAAAAESTILLIGVIVLVVLMRRPLGLTNPHQSAPSGKRGFLDWCRDMIDRFTDLYCNVLFGGAIGRLGRRIGSALSVIRYPVLGLLGVVTLLILVVPQIVVLLVAFNSSPFLSFPPDGFSLQWFDAYFSDEVWMDSTFLSIGVSLIAALLATLLGVLSAFAIARGRNRKVGGVIYVLTMAPLVMPPVIFAVALFLVFIRVDLLGNPLALVLAYTIIGIPYVMLTSQAVIAGIDPLYESAATSLGANAFRRAWDVLRPLLTPAVISAFLFAFVIAFDELVLGVFLGSARTVTIQVRMFQDVRNEISPKIAAVGIALTFAMLLVALIVLFAQRLRSRSGVRSGSRAALEQGLGAKAAIQPTLTKGIDVVEDRGDP